ncbi:hypothetical protein [Agaribacterium sp. ZY112]|uniref:hypothetical protein n=1 Tax=Agaribacterium sp. ZY112 TaxID=3233574 RepID=UPI00352588FC
MSHLEDLLPYLAISILVPISYRVLFIPFDIAVWKARRELYTPLEISVGLNDKQEFEVDKLFVQKTKGRFYTAIRGLQGILLTPVFFAIMAGLGKEEEDGGESIRPIFMYPIMSIFFCALYFLSTIEN